MITDRYLYFGGANYRQTTIFLQLVKHGYVYVSMPHNLPSILRIHVQILISRGQIEQHDIPIPTGCEAQALAVVDYFSWRNKALRDKRAATR